MKTAEKKIFDLAKGLIPMDEVLCIFYNKDDTHFIDGYLTCTKYGHFIQEQTGWQRFNPNEFKEYQEVLNDKEGFIFCTQFTSQQKPSVNVSDEEIKHNQATLIGYMESFYKEMKGDTDADSQFQVLVKYEEIFKEVAVRESQPSKEVKFVSTPILNKFFNYENVKSEITKALKMGCMTNGYDPEIAIEKAMSIFISLSQSEVSKTDAIESVTEMEKRELKDISDEDVLNTLECLDTHHNSIEEGKIWIINSFTKNEWSHRTLNCIKAYQYLESKNYKLLKYN